MNKYIEEQLEYWRPTVIKIASVRAFNEVLGTSYKTSDDGFSITHHYTHVGAPPKAKVDLLVTGELANLYPKNPKYKKVQAVFNEEFTKQNQARVEQAKKELLKRRFESWSIITIVVIIPIIWGLISWHHNHQAAIEKSKFITANNSETKVSVDNTFSFLMPCAPNQPSGVPELGDLGGIKSATYSCSQQDPQGSSTVFYEVKNEVYTTDKYNPLDFYKTCNNGQLIYTDDNGEQFTIIDNHVEDVHGINFAICNTSGNRGTVDIIAKAIKGNSLQYFWLETDSQHQQNIWLKFRGYLESFQYITD